MITSPGRSPLLMTLTTILLYLVAATASTAPASAALPFEANNMEDLNGLPFRHRGDGSEKDPFIIEGPMNILVPKGGRYCIKLDGLDGKFITIENVRCTTIAGPSENPDVFAGIHIINHQGGKIIIGRKRKEEKNEEVAALWGLGYDIKVNGCRTGIKIENSNSVEINNTWAAFNRYGIEILDSQGVVVSHASTPRNYRSGIYHARSGTTELKNVISAHNSHYGVRIRDKSRSVRIDKSRFHHNKLAGIYLDIDSRGSSVLCTKSDNNGEDGIILRKSENNIIENNAFRRNGRHGIYIYHDSDYSRFVGNFIADNTSNGARVEKKGVFDEGVSRKRYDSKKNKFWYNNFINNGNNGSAHAWDGGSQTYWFWTRMCSWCGGWPVKERSADQQLGNYWSGWSSPKCALSKASTQGKCPGRPNLKDCVSVCSTSSDYTIENSKKISEGTLPTFYKGHYPDATYVLRDEDPTPPECVPGDPKSDD